MNGPILVGQRWHPADHLTHAAVLVLGDRGGELQAGCCPEPTVPDTLHLDANPTCPACRAWVAASAQRRQWLEQWAAQWLADARPVD